MNILLCCSFGFSSSILVKSMREAAIQLNRSNYKFASSGADQIYKYIEKVDVILVAPQNIHEYQHIKQIADKFNIPVLLINKSDYGEMDGEKVLLQMEKKLASSSEREVKMDKFSALIETKFMPVAVKVGSNRVLTVIRNAMSATMSILIIGSISVLLTNFPIEAVTNFLEPIAPFLNAVYSATSGMLGLLTAASVAYYAAVEFKTDVFSSILTSTSVFLLTQWSLDGTINMEGLGSSGLLTAIIVSYTTVWTIDLFKRKNLVIKMPAGVPAAVSESFSSLIPAIVLLVVFGSITLVLGFDINSALSFVLTPISKIINNPFGYAVYHIICALVFFCGVNSVVIVGVVLPFILQNGAANEAALKAGEALPFIATKSTEILMWSGGTGATIGLAILMAFFAKSKSLKTLGKMAIVPSVFNINEPIIFGTPIIFNPIFMIPFVFTPGILAFLTYTLMSLGIVATPVASFVPWTLPPVIAGFVMSNGSISLTLWSVAILILTLVCYYPFFKMADKAELKKELEEVPD